MKWTVIAMTIILSSYGVVAQNDDYLHSSDWKLYQLNSDTGHQFSSADTTIFIQLRPDSIQYFLAGYHPMAKERTDGIAWMGDLYLSCKMDGTTRFLRISRYGGFFLDLKSNTYYEIPIEKRAEWHQFLTQNHERLRSQHERPYTST